MEIKVPAVGESITEVEISSWLKGEGDWVQKDEPLVTLETEKATVDVPAPATGKVMRHLKKKGETARVNETIAELEPGTPPTAMPPSVEPANPAKAPPIITPAAQRVLSEHGLRPEQVSASGIGGRLLKEDVLRHVAGQAPGKAAEPPPAPPPPVPAARPSISSGDGDREEEVVPMSRLRRTIAQRLVEAQHQAALLTTFNEVDCHAVMALRKEMGEAFQEKYNVKLGFMSFFVKAAIEALKQFPAVNAEMRENNIVFRNYYDIGIAVSTERGLVVPVLRSAERMSFAEVEIALGDFARRARENKLKLEELQGGTFSITNGGVFGSLLSTPIINPPQSGILGMHAIQERPVAREGAVVIRPMMYLALTYDHRLIDGREAVSFLRHIKEVVENPARILLEV